MTICTPLPPEDYTTGNWRSVFIYDFASIPKSKQTSAMVEAACNVQNHNLAHVDARLQTPDLVLPILANYPLGIQWVKYEAMTEAMVRCAISHAAHPNKHMKIAWFSKPLVDLALQLCLEHRVSVHLSKCPYLIDDDTLFELLTKKLVMQIYGKKSSYPVEWQNQVLANRLVEFDVSYVTQIDHQYQQGWMVDRYTDMFEPFKSYREIRCDLLTEDRVSDVVLKQCLDSLKTIPQSLLLQSHLALFDSEYSQLIPEVISCFSDEVIRCIPEALSKGPKRAYPKSREFDSLIQQYVTQDQSDDVIKECIENAPGSLKKSKAWQKWALMFS